jgi:hypothetical protein
MKTYTESMNVLIHFFGGENTEEKFIPYMPRVDNSKNLCCRCHKEFRLKSRSYCEECLQIYNRKKYANMGFEEKIKLLEKARKKNREKRLQRKINYVNQKGGECERCGYRKNYAALGFHHSEGRIGRIRNYSHQGLISTENPQSKYFDITKVILVCENCHREIEHPQLKIRKNRKNIFFSL